MATLPAVDLKPTESATEQETAKFPLLLRPSMVKKLREKFKDFVMTWLFISEIVYCFTTTLEHFTFSLENICTFGFCYTRKIVVAISSLSFNYQKEEGMKCLQGILRCAVYRVGDK